MTRGLMIDLGSQAAGAHPAPDHRKSQTDVACWPDSAGS